MASFDKVHQGSIRINALPLLTALTCSATVSASLKNSSDRNEVSCHAAAAQSLSSVRMSVALELDKYLGKSQHMDPDSDAAVNRRRKREREREREPLCKAPGLAGEKDSLVDHH